MIDDVLLFICSFCLAFDVFLKLMRLMLFDSKCIVHVHTNLTGRYIPVKVTNSAHAGSVRISEFPVLKQILADLEERGSSVGIFPAPN